MTDALTEAIARAMWERTHDGTWPQEADRDGTGDLYRKDAHAAQAAIRDAGYVVVPREPSEAMYKAGGESEPFILPSRTDPTRMWQPGQIVAATVWRAMIAAAEAERK